MDLRDPDVAAARRAPARGAGRHARQALARAKAVGEEYTGVEVATATVRTRRAGHAIVDEARRRGVEAIVLGAEEPSLIRGGARLGGRGARSKTSSATSPSTSINRADCRVIVTAPAAATRRSAARARAGAPARSAGCIVYSAPRND